ncbi:STAS domain-containing protein [Amycolatopsis nigrescens]|uniref:STAS domain-containing protein n=1 Tax=Amycolatopsis nigrescens TaxID=381445 RepID=UPI00037A7F73|nr:STAS domain-containing protein [Amycolatopsis nigrescens]
MSVTVSTPQQDVVLLTVVGEVDALTVGGLRAALGGVTEGSRLVVDLSRVDFLSCSALEALAVANRRGAGLVLVTTRYIVLRALEATGLRGLFAVLPAVPDALDDTVLR